MGDWPAFIMCGLGLERMKHEASFQNITWDRTRESRRNLLL